MELDDKQLPYPTDNPYIFRSDKGHEIRILILMDSLVCGYFYKAPKKEETRRAMVDALLESLEFSGKFSAGSLGIGIDYSLESMQFVIYPESADDKKPVAKDGNGGVCTAEERKLLDEIKCMNGVDFNSQGSRLSLVLKPGHSRPDITLRKIFAVWG